MDTMAEPESPELQKLSAELRRMEVEQERLELELRRARALDDAEREYRQQQVRALELDNDAKARALDWKRSGVFWTRAGLLVAWIAALVPVTISVNEYWDGREEAARAERKAAEDEREAAIQAAATRFTEGSSTAALELAIYPEGVSFLVGELRGIVEEPEGIEKARAALTALRSLSPVLTEGQEEILRDQRDLGIDHLASLAQQIRDGQAHAERFLTSYEINEGIRLILREDGEKWSQSGEAIRTVYQGIREGAGR